MISIKKKESPYDITIQEDNVKYELEYKSNKVSYDIDILGKEIKYDIETKSKKIYYDLEFGSKDVKKHNDLVNREMPDQHPISAITGLEIALKNAGKVKDIYVNGESVVNEEGIADIDIGEIAASKSIIWDSRISNDSKETINTFQQIYDKAIAGETLSVWGYDEEMGYLNLINYRTLGSYFICIFLRDVGTSNASSYTKLNLTAYAAICRVSNGKIISVSSEIADFATDFLSTTHNYHIPYEPQYDGSPITKKHLYDNFYIKELIKKLYSSTDVNKDTWYSFSGLKAIDNINVPMSETETVNLIEGIYVLLDYKLDDLIDDYPYITDTLHNIVIPKEDYINDIESKHLTIDLFNRGKVILEIKPLGQNYSCSKFTLINYLQGWAVKFTEGASELEVLYRKEYEENDPTVPVHVKNITQNNINNWNNKADKNWVREFYYSTDINKYTWYSYTGIKTINNIKVPISGTQTTNIIEGIYRLLDYGLDALIEDYSYLGYALHNIQIPKEDYINDIESKQITIDLYNRGKAIIETRPFDDIYTCTKLTLINYLQGWAVKFDENKNELEVLYDTDTSEFIKNTVDNLVNYYKKSETYSKEEIDELAKSLDLTGYATEQWVKNQNYMPIQDFQDYVKYFYYTKDEVNSKVKEVDDKITNLSENVYSKEEINTKLENLPTGGTELTGGDNTVIEDNAINVYTNTGYKISDADIKLQTITDSGTSGTNKMLYTDDEVTIIYDGTNKIRRSENGIDFEIITLPCNCSHLAYNESNKRIYGTDNISNFFYSNDNGLTWNLINNSRASNITILDIGFGAGFRATYRSTKEIISWSFNEISNALSQNTRITSTIYPDFIAMANNTQYIWCNSSGTFKYGAGSREADFPSLSGVSINLLKRVNDITFVGLKNNNKFYVLEPASSITAYKWIAYTLPASCTLNDIIYNPYDETYYFLTSYNTYFKTKDFINYENVDTGLKGIKGYFTLMGIQATTNEHNKLLLAPTRTKLENKAQEWDRALNKDRWAGPGLAVDGEQIKILARSPLNVSETGGIGLGTIEEHNIPENLIEGIYAGKAQEKGLFDPYEIENWYFGEGVPVDEQYSVTKFIFNQDGSFYNMATWEDEILVEQYEYGYIFGDSNMNIFKYVKLGNLRWLFDLLGGV